MLTETLSPVMSDALVILGAAGIIIPLFARFRVTPIIGFILVGVLVGPYGLGRFVYDHEWLYYVTISDPARLEPFAEFGIILLLFSIGLELSFGRLWTMRKLVFGLGSLELIVLGSLFAALLTMMGQYWTGAVALGLALAMSSTAVVLPISGTKSPVGQAALSMLLFEGLALVPIIFLLGALAPYADRGGAGLSGALGIGILVVGGMMILGRVVLPYLFAQAARTKSPELFLAVCLLVVISASLATTFAGLSPIVGALLAGLLIAETEYASDVAAILEPFRGLALGIFLLTVGMSIDLRMVWGHLGTIVIALLAVLVVKTLITIVLLRIMGARKSTATETGILMASPSEDTLIIIAAASAAMLIQPGTAQFWQIVTAIGLMITPLLALAGRMAARRIEPRAPHSAAPEADADAPRVIILGCGRVGRLVADMLVVHGKPYIALDSNPDLVERSKRDGYRAVFGNAARTGILEKLGVDSASAVVFTMDEPIATQRTIRKLRRNYPELPIIARARDTAHAAELYRMGATTAVPETLESTLQLSEAVLVDLGVAIGPVIASIHEERGEFRERMRKSAMAVVSR